MEDARQTYEDPVLAQQVARQIMAAPPNMDNPVALPEMGQDFVVEASIPQMRSLKRKKPGSDADLSIVPFEPSKIPPTMRTSLPARG